MLLIVIFLLTVNAQIKWNGSPFAETTAGEKVDGLSVLFTGQEPKGAQLTYTKTNNSTLPLVKVFLEDNSFSYVMQEGFDVINQKCSCYFVDAEAVDAKRPLKSSSTYRLVFRSANGKFVSASGYFGIVKGTDLKTLPKPSASPTTEEEKETTTTSSSIKPSLTKPPGVSPNLRNANSATKYSSGLAFVSILLFLVQ